MEKVKRDIVVSGSMDSMPDDGRVDGTPEYRIGIMWELTRDAWSFSGGVNVERRLQRNVTNFIRGGSLKVNQK